MVFNLNPGDTKPLSFLVSKSVCYSQYGTLIWEDQIDKVERVDRARMNFSCFFLEEYKGPTRKQKQ